MLVSLIGIIFTITSAKEELKTNHALEEMEAKQTNDMTPPDMNANNEMAQPNMNPDNTMTPPDMKPDDEMGMKPSDNPNNAPTNENQNQLTTNHKMIIGIFSSLFSLSLMYVVMSINKKDFYKNKDKLTIYILSNIILISYMTIGITWVTNQKILNNNQMIKEESDDKEEVVLDESNPINSDIINLANQKTDVTITSSGTYTFQGNFSNSIIVDAEGEDVKIVLDGVSITNENTAAIIGLKAKKITITLKEGTTNTLTDGGNSKYDGCIYSETELVFDGTGKLIVNGNQKEGEGIATEAMNMTFNGGTYLITSNDDGLNAGGDGATITINNGTFYINASGDGIDSNKDAIINGGTIFVMGSDTGGNAGIDTDQGYVINGGTVVALGSDMLETPKESSSQKIMTFTLNTSITQNTLVTLMKEEKAIISFEAPKSFKTIIISTKTLENGEYELYTGGSNLGTLENGIYQNSNYVKGEKVVINNEDTFKINGIINSFGNNAYGQR